MDKKGHGKKSDKDKKENGKDKKGGEDSSKVSARDILGKELIDTGAYFKQEHKVKYVRAVLCVASQHERIGVKEAERIFAFAEKGRGITDNKRTTLERVLEGPQEGSAICQNVKFTTSGKTRFKEFLG